MGGKSDAPVQSGNPTEAATATAAGNLAAARAAAQANRVDMYTPWGNSTYSQDPNASSPDSGWANTISLSPNQQKLSDYQDQASLGLASQTGQALNRVDSSLAQPFNMNSAQDATNEAYKNITSRLNPQWDDRQTQQETQLTNQGLRPGSEGWDNAMRDFNYGRNDAYTQADTQAMNYGPQAFQLESAIRSQPLNELNALRTGSQVTTPTFQNVPQQQTTAGANLSGAQAQQDQYNTGIYNANQASASNTQNGLMSLAGTAAMAFAI